MLRVGLTGGTGAGKTTVATRLAQLGAVVVDADALAREVVAPGTEGLAAVVAEFGDGVLGDDGALDRAALAAVVFADDARRRALEAITHPRIAARTADLVAAAAQDAVLVHDVPLLVEKRLGAAYHLVLVVDAPVDVRVARLVSSRGMSEQDARSRVRAQASDEDRRAAADVLLVNDGPPQDVLTAVDRLWHDRLLPYEENLRLRRPAPRPSLPVVTDASWPAQARRLAERLRLAAGPRALRVDHVGPTAVPGAEAPDVVGLQLTVSSPQDVAAVAPALEAAGFVRSTAEPASAWEGTALHAGCDPGRFVDVTVVAASAGETGPDGC